VSAAVGLALIGALALLFRRRRRRKATLYHSIYLESSAGTVDTGRVELGDGDRLRKKNARLTSSNGGDFCGHIKVCVNTTQKCGTTDDKCRSL